MSEHDFEAIPTRWSLVRIDTTNQQANGAEQRRLLVLRYASAIRRYVGAIVRATDDADELSQDVIMRLMRGDFAGADPSRGRFRDLLKVAIRNMIRNHWDKSKRRQTADANLDSIGSEDDSQDRQWTSAWQKSVLDHTWHRLDNDEPAGKGPNMASKVLRLRVDHPDDSSEQLAQRLSQQLGTEIKPDAFRQMLSRARKRFVSYLIDEVKSGLDDESDERLDEELAALQLLHWLK